MKLCFLPLLMQNPPNPYSYFAGSVDEISVRSLNQTCLSEGLVEQQKHPDGSSLSGHVLQSDTQCSPELLAPISQLLLVVITASLGQFSFAAALKYSMQNIYENQRNKETRRKLIKPTFKYHYLTLILSYLHSCLRYWNQQLEKQQQ